MVFGLFGRGRALHRSFSLEPLVHATCIPKFLKDAQYHLSVRGPGETSKRCARASCCGCSVLSLPLICALRAPVLKHLVKQRLEEEMPRVPAPDPSILLRALGLMVKEGS